MSLGSSLLCSRWPGAVGVGKAILQSQQSLNVQLQFRHSPVITPRYSCYSVNRAHVNLPSASSLLSPSFSTPISARLKWLLLRDPCRDLGGNTTSKVNSLQHVHSYVEYIMNRKESVLFFIATAIISSSRPFTTSSIGAPCISVTVKGHELIKQLFHITIL